MATSNVIPGRRYGVDPAPLRAPCKAVQRGAVRRALVGASIRLHDDLLDRHKLQSTVDNHHNMHDHLSRRLHANWASFGREKAADRSGVVYQPARGPGAWDRLIAYD